MKYILGGLVAAATLVAVGFSQPQPTQAAQLSDGFYKSKKKVYFVVNGHRARVKKGNTYRTLVKVAQKGGITPISNATYDKLQTDSCYRNEPLDPTGSYYAECLRNLAEGEVLREQLKGKMLLHVEQFGWLTYVSKKQKGRKLISITTQPQKLTTFQYAKKQAKRVREERILGLTKWRSVESLR